MAFRTSILLLTSFVVAFAPERSAAQSTTADRQALESLQKRLDQLEQQNRELQNAVRTMQMPAAPQPADIGLGFVEPPKDPPAKAEPPCPPKAESQGNVVGSMLNFRAIWTTNPGGTGNQLWFETEDKAYRAHFGGRVQPDFVLGAGASNRVEQGAGGAGPFLEGFNFRRARLEADGWMHENIDYFIEFDFANTPYNTGVRPGNTTLAGTPTNTQPFANVVNDPAPTDVWVTLNYLPIIGGVRFGNFKPPIGLDHLTSSRFLDFMERSSGFDIYYNRNNGFEPGVMLFNSTEDKLATYQLSMTRTSNSAFGFDQGGGAWDFCGRLTWLPVYEDDGRYMVHLGLGAKWQTLDRSIGGAGLAVLNERWLLRNSQSGLQNVVALAALTGDSQAIVNPEFFMNVGSLSLQAEYLGSQINGVTSYATQLTPKAVPVSSRSFTSQAAYVQALYFLTGEYRPYGRTAVHGSGAAPTRVVPYSNFFWLRGEEGNIWSLGAWQVGARYCYSTLDDGVINGGIVNEVTLGLNWFLNPNLKFQWNYDLGHRELRGGSSDGNYYGFGMRMAFDF